ncbi:MAG: TonB-dependent receptor, partial [Bacteroidota bacterium]
MKIKYLFLIAMLCLFHQSFAQISIFGSVIDSDNQPVSFANVLLVSPQDSALIKGTVTDSLGRFQLANVSPGAYRIQSNMIGFQTSYAPYLLSLSSNQTDTTLAAIQLLQENIGLDAITVTAKKPIFIRLADRTIVNVQNSPTLVGNSALQVLERSPGVSLNRQSNSLSMYGKTGVRIMINGKASRLPADAVIQMLDGMSAANIASIELITSPSSDFDAEGNGGIINIVLKENLAQGTNGNLGFTLGYNQAETLGANFNLNHRAKKVNLFLDYTIHYDKYEVPWDNSRFIRTPTFEKKSISLSDRVPKKTVQNLRAGIEYLITPDFTLNA